MKSNPVKRGGVWKCCHKYPHLNARRLSVARSTNLVHFATLSTKCGRLSRFLVKAPLLRTRALSVDTGDTMLLPATLSSKCEQPFVPLSCSHLKNKCEIRLLYQLNPHLGMVGGATHV